MDEDAKHLAKSMAAACVRDTLLEDWHGGTIPHSETGDYSDVKLVTPIGEIPWNELSRISEEEMQLLMKDVVNRIYTVLANLDSPVFVSALHKWTDGRTTKWDDPELVRVVPTHLMRSESENS